MLLQLAPQLGKAGAAGAQDAGGDGVSQQSVEQVLERDVLVPPRFRLGEGEPQRRLELLRDAQRHPLAPPLTRPAPSYTGMDTPRAAPSARPWPLSSRPLHECTRPPRKRHGD